ncbi:MAG: hypothetical protein U1C71_01450, partial [archaeon]|nr:hypothetical protein [archaeon]
KSPGLMESHKFGRTLIIKIKFMIDHIAPYPNEYMDRAKPSFTFSFFRWKKIEPARKLSIIDMGKAVKISIIT